MKIKKTIVCMLAAAFAASCFACTPEEKDVVRVYMPDGAPAIALSYFMHEGYDNTEFTVVNANKIRGYVADGTADLAIIPANAAAALYNDNIGIQMVSVNTHGNLYIVSADENGEDIAFSDLVGKKIAVIMQYDVPGQVFRMLLNETETASVTMSSVNAEAVSDKVNVFYGDAASAKAALVSGNVDYALLPEPQVTNVVKALSGRVVCDIQQQWKTLIGGSFPQACLVAKNSLDRSYVDNFLAALKAADGWAEEHPVEAVEAVKSHAETGTESTIPALSAAVIKGCNIKTVSASDGKASCAKYFTALTKLKNADETPTLAKVPDDGFYYTEA